MFYSKGNSVESETEMQIKISFNVGNLIFLINEYDREREGDTL